MQIKDDEKSRQVIFTKMQTMHTLESDLKGFGCKPIAKEAPAIRFVATLYLMNEYPHR